MADRSSHDAPYDFRLEDLIVTQHSVRDITILPTLVEYAIR